MAGKNDYFQLWYHSVFTVSVLNYPPVDRCEEVRIEVIRVILLCIESFTFL